MLKKNINRDEWGKANGYKVFHSPTCAQCKHFNSKYGSAAQGNCDLMYKDGVNSDVTLTAVCNQFSYKKGG